jgi:hypothetical protein
VFERRQFQDLRGGDGQRESREREIDAFETQRRQPEQKAGDEAHDSRGGQGPDIAHTILIHQDCSGVGAERIKGTVTQRELSVDSRQQVQTKNGDRIDKHLRELKHEEVLEQKRN